MQRNVERVREDTNPGSRKIGFYKHSEEHIDHLYYSKAIKSLLIVLGLATGIISCRKPKTKYKPFSETELDFACYTSNQKSIRLIDTSGNVNVLMQYHYSREFRQFTGLYGESKKYCEYYGVSYAATYPSTLSFSIGIQGEYPGYSQGEIVITMYPYYAYGPPVSFPIPISTKTVNNISYQNVYSIQAYKYGYRLNSPDSATVLWNRKYGFIQFQYPNGKAITRTD